MIQIIHKNSAFILVLQKYKGELLFADIVFVKDDDVMAEMVKFKRLDLRHDGVDIMFFLKDAEVQNEDRVVGVHGIKTVVSALINIDYVVTVIHGALVVFDNNNEVSIPAGRLATSVPWVIAGIRNHRRVKACPYGMMIQVY